jgi:DNA transformation protein
MPGSKQNEFVNYLVDLMQSIGPVNARRMFGGHGLFLNGLMFALIADDTLYFKADGESEARFTAKGLKAFTYDRKGKPCSLAYYEAPEDSLENIEQMIIWANRAYAAALRASSARRR